MNRSMIDLWVGVFVAAGFGGLLFLVGAYYLFKRAQ